MKTLLLLLNFALAKDLPEVWSHPHKAEHYLFVRNETTKALISQDCADNSKCEALTTIQGSEKNKKINLPEGSTAGGKNPTAVMCTLGFKMEVVILKGKNNSEASFCKFKDGSMISTHMLEKFI